ncbi:Golgi transport complex subunit 3 [Tulasnella sp. JGI-2019a]|nr:Golgi transport complex subunit 3 [Tulasnella sp. JGI-2019a]
MHRRPAIQGLSTLPTLNKTPISLEEWESKAPLSETETRSVGIVKSACETRPLPSKFVDSVEPISRPSTPVGRVASPAPRDGGTPSTKHPHRLHPSQPITTPQQFHDWFALIDKSISHSQEAHFRQYLNSVTGHLSNCDTLLERATEVDEDVARMMVDWTGVEEGGQSLQGACERMLEERDRLMQVTDAIEERLEYFQELEHATQMLNHPGDGLVVEEAFLRMVERVDVCIEYLEAHRQFRESQLYLMRYRHCLTRAMTLIKMHFVNAIKSVTSEVQRRMGDKDMSLATQNLLLYAKFQAASNALRPVIGELEARAVKHPEELSALLGECHAAYFYARKQLITGRLIEEIRRMIVESEAGAKSRSGPATIDLVGLTRSGCTYLKHMCMDEFGLFQAFFDSGEDQLYGYLEGLCDHLYDDLRPRILHETKLAVLCQVCTVIQALMVLDVHTNFDATREDESDESNNESDNDDDDEEEDEEEAEEIGAQFTHTAPTLRELHAASESSQQLPQNRRLRGRRQHRRLRRLHVGILLEMIHQDAQTRLVFRAQTVVQSEIRYYVMKEGDLDYPQKLLNAQEQPYDAADDLGSFVQPLLRLPSLTRMSTWYPTLKKTHWVLSQLYDYVKPAIFEDIAYEAISLCKNSLISASEALSAKLINDKSSNPDGKLFLIRHLLILKELTTALGLEVQRDRGVDFSGVTDTLGSLIFNPLGGGLSGLRLPKVVENIADARLELDIALKTVCEDSISQCVAAATLPLLPILEGSVSAKSPAKPSHQVLQEFKAAAEREIPGWVTKLKLYLDNDEKTVGIMLPPMQDKVAMVYERFLEMVANAQGGHEVEELMSVTDIGAFVAKLSGA